MSIYESVYNAAYEHDFWEMQAGTRSAELAGIAAVVVAAKKEALAPVLALHKPETRYYPSGIDDRSWDTEDEAREYADSEDEAMQAFTICAECGRVESEQLREYADDWGYRESIWPCPTRKATQ